MKYMGNEDRRLDINNIYSLNRISSDDKIEEGAHPAPVKKLVKKLLIDKNLL
jgi:hypothetical protein